MEIGQEDIDRAKAIAGRDEDRGLALERRDRAVFGGSTFQEPQRGGADRDDASAARARRVQGRGVSSAPFRSSYSASAPAFTNFGKFWALANRQC